MDPELLAREFGGNLEEWKRRWSEAIGRPVPERGPRTSTTKDRLRAKKAQDVYREFALSMDWPDELPRDYEM